MMNGTRFELNGIEYKTNEKGNYFYKDGKRISRGEFEMAFDEYIGQVDEADEEIEDEATAEQDAKKATLDAEMEKLGYQAIDSEWNDIRYSNDAHQVMAWNTVEEGLEWLEEQWEAQAEAEKEARQKEQEKKDHEAEDRINGKKKSTKKRRSKDIAHESNGVTLTVKQVDFMRHLPDTNFWENGLDSQIWCDVLADEIGGQFTNKPMTVGAMISTLREKGLVTVSRDDSRKGKPKYMELTELGKAVAVKLGIE